jgi:small conductance mechanosensitive channel
MNETMLEAATRIWHSLGVVAISGARIVGIVLVAWLALGVSRRALRLMRARIAVRLEDAEAIKRADTLARVFRYIATVVISLITFIAVLSELGVSVAPILGAAGVVGLAVGFGAQSLVKDYVTGLFLLVENQIRQGDVVQLGEHSGSVEEVTLRYVRLRDYGGNVYYIPNGTISTVINMSRGFAHAVVDVGVAYGADLDRAMQVMREVCAAMRAEPEFAGQILDDIEIAGVQDWADSAVKIRARIRVIAMAQWAVRRAFLLRLKRAFDARGIEIPFPQLTLHRRRDADAPAATAATMQSPAPAPEPAAGTAAPG